MAANERLADDLMRGVPAIADFIGERRRQTYDLLENGKLPGFKLPDGRIWHAFKSKIRRHYEKLANGPQETA